MKAILVAYIEEGKLKDQQRMFEAYYYSAIQNKKFDRANNLTYKIIGLQGKIDKLNSFILDSLMKVDLGVEEAVEVVF